MWAVVVAAGGGSRFGGKKQFAMIGGRPMVDWSLSTARAVVDGVVLVVPAGDPRISSPGSCGADIVVEGGKTRAESVRAGLAAVPDDAGIVVVHDGARPLATTALFAAVIGEVRSGADAAVPATPVADTLKRVADGAVSGTVERDGLVAVQTPQAFRADVLRRAHATGGDATDDAGLVEALGIEVRVVPGEARNLKVTTAADLELAQQIAEERGDSGL